MTMCVVLSKYAEEGAAESEIPGYGDLSGVFSITDLAYHLLMSC